jgi:hypothetical protein
VGLELAEFFGAVGHGLGFILLISIEAFLFDGIQGRVDRFQGIGDALDEFE